MVVELYLQTTLILFTKRTAWVAIKPPPAPALMWSAGAGSGSHVLHGPGKTTRSRAQHRTIMEQNGVCWASVGQQTPEQNGVLFGLSPAPTVCPLGAGCVAPGPPARVWGDRGGGAADPTVTRQTRVARTDRAMKETKMRAFAQSQRKLDGENRPANQIAP